MKKIKIIDLLLLFIAAFFLRGLVTIFSDNDYSHGTILIESISGIVILILSFVKLTDVLFKLKNK